MPPGPNHLTSQSLFKWKFGRGTEAAELRVRKMGAWSPPGRGVGTASSHSNIPGSRVLSAQSCFPTASAVGPSRAVTVVGELSSLGRLCFTARPHAGLRLGCGEGRMGGF